VGQLNYFSLGSARAREATRAFYPRRDRRRPRAAIVACLNGAPRPDHVLRAAAFAAGARLEAAYAAGVATRP